MPVAVQAPQRREQRDPLDTIMKGLSIASSIYGIKEAGQKRDLLRQQFAMEQEKADAAEFADAEKLGAQQDQLAAEKTKTEGDLFAKGVITKKDASGNVAGYERDPKYKPENSGLAAQIQAMRLQEMQTRAGTGTPDQNKVALFAQRTLDAEKVFDDLSGSGYTGTDVGAEVQKTGLVPERFKSNDFKKLEQAQRNFINAVLRRESGAMISEDEFASAAKQYFPQPGDPPEVLEQKKQNRLLVISGLSQEAGPAFANLQNARSRDVMAGSGPQINMNNRGGGISMLPPAANASEVQGGGFADTQNAASQILLKRQGMKGRLPK